MFIALGIAIFFTIVAWSLPSHLTALRAPSLRTPTGFAQEVYRRLIDGEGAYTSRHRMISKNNTQGMPWDWPWKGFDYPRIPCIVDFRDWVSKHHISPERVLSTAPEDPEVKLVPHRILDTCQFKLEPERCDLHVIAPPDDGYDLVIVSQTFEHLYDPLLAATRMFEQVAPGGLLFTSLPTHNIPHMQVGRRCSTAYDPCHPNDMPIT